MSIESNRFTFFNKFIHSPFEIGSICPSSTYLTKKMFVNLLWERMDTIVELGAGTGVFTKTIHENINSLSKVLIIEKDVQMRLRLETAYPSFNYGSDAEELDTLLHELSIPQVDCIISSLPFANFTSELRTHLMYTISKCLKPNGLFVAYQYSLQMKSLLQQFFEKVEIGFELRNIPPAFVYTCKKN